MAVRLSFWQWGKNDMTDQREPGGVVRDVGFIQFLKEHLETFHDALGCGLKKRDPEEEA